MTLNSDDGDVSLLAGEGGGDLGDEHGEESFVVDADRSGNVEGGMGRAEAGGVLCGYVDGDREELGGAEELVGSGQERGEGRDGVLETGLEVTDEKSGVF